jgi:lipase maturation factor 1
VIRGAHRKPRARATRRAFLTGLGLVYLVAFVSLWVQVRGLIGPQGILPAGEFLSLLLERFGSSAPWHFPTLGWLLGAGDGALDLLCGVGAFASLLLAVGVAPALTSLLCWVFYLSLFTLAQRFLGFQWDILLLEAGFLAIFLAPPLLLDPRPGVPQAPPSRIVIWLYRLLLFKLMFSSGVVKLSSHDPSWRDLTALTYHYETTCLPAWTGWLLHQLPPWFHELSAVLMFGVELVLPFFVFGPRLLRLLAAAGFTGLMVFIGLTGNYGFFNLLAVVLCIPLLDDGYVPARLRRWLAPARERTPLGPNPGRFSWPLPFLVVLGLLIGLLDIVPILGAFRIPVEQPTVLADAYGAQEGWHLVNGYGLFATMTTRRPEIVFEGSDDGLTWKPYELPYKPGDVSRRPPLIGFHMPRLDWLLWFAALGNPRQHAWVARLAHRLLEGAPPVLELFAKNPFPDSPPRYLRATLYDYRFTSFAERETTGAWWKRTAIGSYLPEVYIPEGRPDTLALLHPPE